jgi:rod shape-determining protein MreB
MGILKWIRRMLTGGPFYVRISRDQINVTNSKSGSSFIDEPIVAISEPPNRTILAIGSKARIAGGVSVNPFSHPRLFVYEFEVLEKLFQHAFSVVSKSRVIAPAPIVVIHVVEKLEGGLTDIEKRVLLEAAFSAGAYDVKIWDGPELTNQQLQAGEYSRGAI